MITLSAMLSRQMAAALLCQRAHRKLEQRLRPTSIVSAKEGVGLSESVHVMCSPLYRSYYRFTVPFRSHVSLHR